MRIFLMTTLFLLGFNFAQAEPQVTFSSCVSSDNPESQIEAVIRVTHDQDQNGKPTRSLASYLAFNEVSMPTPKNNCTPSKCTHMLTDEAGAESFTLYPHYKPQSDALSSITLVSKSSIAIFEDELRFCKVVDKFPTEDLK